jgi:hypothetical protein
MKLCIDGFQGFFLWLPEEVLALLFSSLSWEWRFLYSYERYIQGCKLNQQQITVQFCIGRLIVYSASQTDNTSFSLPYRLVFAVATLDSLFIYDTQHSSPIVVVAGLHYAAITDIAWCVNFPSLPLFQGCGVILQ